ncbi:hypothetical protein P153DRAFT_394600 [Dothidotthia symphoricarpi CBS 119687]|uniref:Uncharacterized protein n=1 Tax=Dothidotthia symphoricarpi CBS 119687 TaxID=1392245 RepID=A0A6A6AMR0_9PLEO|nr:uncharacterized protein P153DRAFT_394600 [Dothidotthia symphoricarpi CBS 119687]KAF2132463.1 hypothetical protein P153DRAFT_394600 [Dothidotthia symphoricarpi CBS 119687]
MRFTTSIILFALSMSVQATCNIPGQGSGTTSDTRCCWGGSEGSDACYRQNGYAGCGNGIENANFCRNVGVPNSRCNSDCCDIATGRGQPCPRGNNRCDKDSGCPYRRFPQGTLI